MVGLCGIRLQRSDTLESVPHRRHKKLNKRRGAYSSKYGISRHVHTVYLIIIQPSPFTMRSESYE